MKIKRGIIKHQVVFFSRKISTMPTRIQPAMNPMTSKNPVGSNSQNQKHKPIVKSAKMTPVLSQNPLSGNSQNQKQKTILKSAKMTSVASKNPLRSNSSNQKQKPL